MRVTQIELTAEYDRDIASGPSFVGSGSSSTVNVHSKPAKVDHCHDPGNNTKSLSQLSWERKGSVGFFKINIFNSHRLYFVFFKYC